MKGKSDARKAVADILRSLKGIFEDYTRTARQNAWKSIMSGPAQKEIHKLIQEPTKPLISPMRFARFKEWLDPLK